MPDPRGRPPVESAHIHFAHWGHLRFLPSPTDAHAGKLSRWKQPEMLLHVLKRSIQRGNGSLAVLNKLPSNPSLSPKRPQPRTNSMDVESTGACTPLPNSRPPHHERCFARPVRRSRRLGPKNAPLGNVPGEAGPFWLAGYPTHGLQGCRTSGAVCTQCKTAGIHSDRLMRMLLLQSVPAFTSPVQACTRNAMRVIICSSHRTPVQHALGKASEASGACSRCLLRQHKLGSFRRLQR